IVTDRHLKYRLRTDRAITRRFAALSFSIRLLRSMRSVFWPALLMVYDRSPCILLPDRYRCTLPATTSIFTRTPADVAPAAVYGSTSPRTFSTLLSLSAQSYRTTLAARSPTSPRRR